MAVWHTASLIAPWARPVMLKTLSRILSSPSGAQAPRLDPARGIKSYLLTIVHNKAIDRLRQRSRRSESDIEKAGPLRSPADDPEDMAVQSEDRDRVRNALGALSMEQRQTVELTYFAGLTTAEAAERMRVPVGTVKSRLRLALEHMRRRLATRHDHYP